SLFCDSDTGGRGGADEGGPGRVVTGGERSSAAVYNTVRKRKARGKKSIWLLGPTRSAVNSIRTGLRNPGDAKRVWLCESSTVDLACDGDVPIGVRGKRMPFSPARWSGKTRERHPLTTAAPPTTVIGGDVSSARIARQPGCFRTTRNLRIV